MDPETGRFIIKLLAIWQLTFHMHLGLETIRELKYFLTIYKYLFETLARGIQQKWFSEKKIDILSTCLKKERMEEIICPLLKNSIDDHCMKTILMILWMSVSLPKSMY